jgi:hypothetical protein
MSGFLQLEGKRALITSGTRGAGALATVASPGVHVHRRRSHDRAGLRLSAAAQECLGEIDIIVHILGGSSTPDSGFYPRAAARFRQRRPSRLL